MATPLIIEWIGISEDMTAVRIISSEDKFNVVALNDVSVESDDPTAELSSELIDNMAASFPGKLEMLFLGSLTDLALALQKDASLATKIAKVHIIGSSTGNDASFLADPESASIVIASGIPIVLYAAELLGKPLSSYVAAAMLREKLTVFQSCRIEIQTSAKNTTDMLSIDCASLTPNARILQSVDRKGIENTIIELASGSSYNPTLFPTGGN